MSTNYRRRIPVRAALTAIIATSTACAVLAGAGTALAAAPPVKLVLANHLVGGFELPYGVAVDNAPKTPAQGDVYVADTNNHRLQEFTPAGELIAMFGWEVNKTKVEAHAPQAEQNICTAASKDTCQAGVNGAAAGQFSRPESIAVDPLSGDVYVAEVLFIEGGSGFEFGRRVQEFTGEGRFVLEIGKEVNKTTKGNLCTEAEVEKAGVECAGSALGAAGAVGPSEDGAFHFTQFKGGLVAAGGKEDLLYVGDEHRVQEFKADGTWAGEISLTSISAAPEYFVQSLAVDQETSDVYLVYSSDTGSDIVREFDSSGKEAANLQVRAREGGGEVTVRNVALDSSGNIAVSAFEESSHSVFGTLYNAATGHRITEFTTSNEAGAQGMSFNAEGDLYVASTLEGEVLAYTPELVAELLAKPAACTPGLGNGTSVVFGCALQGEANPEGVAGTEVFFAWGFTEALGENTPGQPVTTGSAPVAVQAAIGGLRPNQALYYQFAGNDQHVQAPEQLASERVAMHTPTVPPRVVGVPSASFVSSSSAVLSGELNPENAGTRYVFLYAPQCASGETCPGIAQAPGVAQTGTHESGVYGTTGVTLEARGLQPATTYRFQLAAVNQAGEEALNETGGAVLPQGTFTTAPAPVPQAATGTASTVDATSATISGSIDPDGLPATYSFEAGVYEGAATQYGVVFSGPAGAGSAPVEETYPLSGLQPGVTYAFRIVVHSGYIDNGEGTLRGAPVLFTTLGVPTVLTAPTSSAQLAIPSISFPKAASPDKGKKQVKSKKKKKKKRTKTKSKSGKSAKARRARAKQGRPERASGG